MNIYKAKLLQDLEDIEPNTCSQKQSTVQAHTDTHAHQPVNQECLAITWDNICQVRKKTEKCQQSVQILLLTFYLTNARIWHVVWWIMTSWQVVW